MAVHYHISDLPDDLPSGEYDVRITNARFVHCRDGSVDWVIETSFRGPYNEADPSLLHFTKAALEELSSATNLHKDQPATD
jgi:hypothetical protein